jgi:hypothetical protein
MPTLLLIGEDNLLLHTRAAVLRTLSVQTTAINPLKLSGLPGEPNFDLVILCHSMKARVAAAAASLVRSRWPNALLLRISSAKIWEAPDAPVPADAICYPEPEQLISCTAKLLHIPPQHHGNRPCLV